MTLPDFSEFVADPDEDALARLRRLATALQNAQLDRAEIDDALKAKNREIRHLSEVLIPDLMEEMGLSEITLDDGSKLSVGKNVRASIPATRREEAMQWILDHGFGDIIKHQVVVDAGKGDASELIATIEAAGHMARDDQSVHPQTLKKFITDLLAEGEDVPMEVFGAHVINEAKLKKPRKKASDF